MSNGTCRWAIIPLALFAVTLSEGSYDSMP